MDTLRTLLIFSALLSFVGCGSDKDESPHENTPAIPDVPGLDLPASHPRLWFTSMEKLQQARSWYAAEDLAPGQLENHDNDNHAIALDLCFDYLMTGNADHGNAAAGWLMDFELPGMDEISNDHARWYMESAILIYDWCHDRLTATQREDRIAYFNEVLLTLYDKPWGHDPMPANNYFQGYLRNAIEWVIASAHENPEALELWEKYVGHRLQEVLLPYYNFGGGRGGTPGEGGQYGVYMIDYSLIPYASMREFDATGGTLDMYSRTAFFRENLFYVLSSMLPGPTHMYRVDEHGTPQIIQRLQLFPFGDDEKFRNQHLARAYADAFLAHSILWRDSAPGAYARQALAFIDAEASRPFRALAERAAMPEPWNTLPLDYFAAGSGHLFARNRWPDADDERDVMVMHFQGGQVEGVGHYHDDAMNLQLWRGNARDGGWFLTRETTAYGDCLAGFDGSRGNGNATLFHNGVSFEGRGQLLWRGPGGPEVRHDNGDKWFRADLPDGLPVVERLASDPQFVHVAGDYTRAYRAARGENPPRYDLLPYVEQVRRDVIFIRELEAVIVQDRLDVADWHDLDTGELIKAAAEIRATVNWHFGLEPMEDGNRFSATYGEGPSRQHFIVHALTPAEFNVVDETDWPEPPRDEDGEYLEPLGCDNQPPNVGQHRLEIFPRLDANGAGQLITVLQGADSPEAAADLHVALVEETPDAHVVRLAHAQRGTAIVTLPKDSAAEARFEWWNDDANGQPDRTALLRKHRDYMYVDDSGPVWTSNGTGAVESDDRVLVGGYDANGLLVLEQRVPESSFDRTRYRVPKTVKHHRLLRLRPGNYTVTSEISSDELVITVERGSGDLEVGNDFALEFMLGDDGKPALLHPSPDN